MKIIREDRLVNLYQLLEDSYFNLINSLDYSRTPGEEELFPDKLRENQKKRTHEINIERLQANCAHMESVIKNISKL